MLRFAGGINFGAKPEQNDAEKALSSGFNFQQSALQNSLHQFARVS